MEFSVRQQVRVIDRESAFFGEVGPIQTIRPVPGGTGRQIYDVWMECLGKNVPFFTGDIEVVETEQQPA